ncbi:MAG TPA: LacI family DNA-binding transcriptional regulator [Chthonomonadaceae bacterium]|nr:LacI family DNA-binding transcriptional regulator [Chthonomonadaceae bacterium]
MRVTLRDLAKACGVSVATVSYVLNNSPRHVHPRTRERVLAAMRELDYHPNAVARGLCSKRMNTLGVVTPYWPAPEVDLYFATILHGIMVTAQQNRQCTLLFTHGSLEAPMDEVPIYLDGRCDGLLFVGGVVDRVIETLKRKQMPLVAVHEPSSDTEVSTIDVDNVAAAREIVEYLVRQGHRRIAYLSGETTLRSSLQRLEGYRQALEAAGIPYEEGLVWPGGYNTPSGYLRTIEHLHKNRRGRPTALFCAGDGIAIGALEALHELGIRVPTEMSVVGFDDISAAASSHPPLTTMRQPLRDIGSRAAELLLEQIKASRWLGRKEVMPTELIVRDSVAPPS